MFDFATDNVNGPIEWASEGRDELVNSLMGVFVVHEVHTSGLFCVE